MARLLAQTLACGLTCATVAGAQTDGWGPIYDTSALGPGKAACWSEGENSACLLLTCRNDGPFEIGLLAIGGGFGSDTSLPVFIRVDGGTAHELRMTRLNFAEYQHAAVPYDPERHADLLGALRTGRWASIALHEPDANPLPYPLGNRPEAVDAAMDACGAARPFETGSAANPDTDGSRFVEVDPGLRDREATALAAGLLADALAAEPETDVTASIAVLPDGRRILVAEHGVSTTSYGIAGVGTHVYTAAPGGNFRPAYQTPGVMVWLDTANLSEGFPDLWVRGLRGLSRPFGVWRHVGGRYVHRRNVPVR